MTLIQRAPPGILDAGRGLARAAKPRLDALRDAWPVARAHWKIVLAVPLALVALAVAWHLLAPAQYTASARLMVDPAGLQAVAGEVNGKGQVSDTSPLVVDSQIDVLTSNTVLGRVVDSEHLDTDPEFTRSAPLESLVAIVSAAVNGVPVDSRVNAIRKLRSITSVERVDRGLVIDVSVASHSRDLTVRLVNAITTAYLDADRAARANSLQQVSAAMTARLDQLSQAARAADDTVQQFKAAHGIVGFGVDPVGDQQLANLTAALGRAEVRTADEQARLKQIDSVAHGQTGLESVAEVVQSPAIAELRSQLATAESRLRGLLTQGGDRLPAVVDARAQVATLRNQISDEIQRIASAAHNDYTRALSNEEALRASLDRLKTQAVQFNTDSVQLRALQRQADAARDAYDGFLARSRQLDDRQNLTISAARLISPPLAPSGRDGPDMLVVLAGALLAGLGLGAGGVVIGDRLNGRIRSPGRLEQATGHTVVASLPTLPELRLEGNEPVPANAREIDRAVSLLLTRLRTHRAGNAPLAILVTSGDDRRNKSALALYLALCGTLDRQKVLLVDADPQGLVTHAVCGGQAPGRDGSAKTLGGLAVAHIDSFPGLRVVSPIDGTAVEQLFAARFPEEIAVSDLIVIDAPLIGTDPLTERLIADERIGAIVFTASAMRSTVGAVRRTVALIAHDQRLTPVLCDEEAEVSSA